MVGTRRAGGHEDAIEITFEKFTELIDTSKLIQLLDKSNTHDTKSNTSR
jgi:hypothetical protein